MIRKRQFISIMKLVLFSLLFLSLISGSFAFIDSDANCEFINPAVDSSLVDNYYIRNQSVDINELASRLKKYGIIAITGAPGSGKLQLASYYADKVFPEKFSKQKESLVYTIQCETQAILDKSYYDFAIAFGMQTNMNLGISADKKKDTSNDIERAKAYVKRKLKSDSYKNRSLVLIFAGCNVLSYNKLKSYLPLGLDPEQQQLIITSQQIHFIPDNKDQNFQIGGFTPEEAIAFLKDNSKIQDKEAIAVAKKCNNLPYNLQAAKLYVKSSIMPISWNYYLNLRDDPKTADAFRKQENTLMKSNGFYNKADRKVVESYIDSLVRDKIFSNEMSRYLFKTCSLFNYTDTPLPILQYLLSKKFSLEEKQTYIEFNAFLEVLKDNGLITDLFLEASPNRVAINPIAHQQAELQMNQERDEEAIIRLILGYFDKGSAGWSNEQLGSIFLFRNPQHRLTILQYMFRQIDCPEKCNGNSCDTMKSKPIIFASATDQIEIAKLLIENGADINETDNTGITTLMEASSNGQLEIVKLLIEKGADVNKVNAYGETALAVASYYGHLEIVRLLIEKGADVNEVDKNGRTALMEASPNGWLEIIKLLIEKGADVNKADIHGTTALAVASHYGHLEIVRLLIEKGADINKVDENGNTALAFAGYYGGPLKVDNSAYSQIRKLEILKLLIEKGADVNKVDNNGRTALMLTSSQRSLKNEEIKQLLRSKGAH